MIPEYSLIIDPKDKARIILMLESEEKEVIREEKISSHAMKIYYRKKYG